MDTAPRSARRAQSLTFLSLTLLACGLLLGAAVVMAQNQPKKKPAAQPQSPAPAATAGKTQTAHPGHSLGMKFQKEGQGIVVSDVDQSGPASKAGLRDKDQIVSADQAHFNTARQLVAYLASSGGRQIPIVVMRDGRPQTVLYTPPFRSGDSAWLGVFLEEEPAPANGSQSNGSQSNDAQSTGAHATGARITQVYPDGPAARAGLHPGDVVVQVDEDKIAGPSDLVAFLMDSAPQTQTKFTVVRNEKQETVPVTLGAHHQQGAVQYAGPQNQQEGHAENDSHAFDTIPPYAMRLEHDRRNAEQHQRIEEEVRALREEIHQLREELKQSKK